jgi:hypothetical protein
VIARADRRWSQAYGRQRLKFGQSESCRRSGVRRRSNVVALASR